MIGAVAVPLAACLATLGMGAPPDKPGSAANRVSFRVLLRSEAHSIAFGFFVILGIVIASGNMAASASLPAVLSGSLSVAYLALLGFRTALAIPAGAKAAWIYAMCSNLPDPRVVLRKVAYTVLLVVCCVATAGVAVMASGFGAALLHGLYVFTFGALLSDCLLANVRRVPFTSRLPEFQNRTLLLILLHALFFLVFVNLGARLELVMLDHRISFLAIPFVLAVWKFAFRRFLQSSESVAAGPFSETDALVQTLAIDS